MRARREHSGTRAGQSWTNLTETKHCAAICFVARIAALCQRSGVRRVAGRGAGVCARAGPHGATARHLPPVASRRGRHRGGPQDGVRRVPPAAGGAPVELLGRRRRPQLRTRHAHRDKGGSVHVRHYVGRRDACAERGVRARRPACLPVHHQPSSWHVDVGAVRVGRLRRGRVRRAPGAALPGRARAGAGRARAHEPAQQPRGPEGERDSERASPSRVQVPRRVGLVCGAHVLARAAALPRRGGRAARALRARAAGGAARAAPRQGPPAAHHASRARPETEAEPGRGAGPAQVRPGVPGAVAVVLRARRRHRLARHACAHMQQNFQRRDGLRVAVLRARVQHGAARGRDQVPLPLPLVLPRHVRHVRRAHRDAHLQLTAAAPPAPRAPHQTLFRLTPLNVATEGWIRATSAGVQTAISNCVNSVLCG